jgi:uncharacterized repeat protein (TIGR01451 family)
VGHAKFRGLTLATLAAALMFIVGVPSATAVHDLGLFELDENAVAETAAPGEDWQTIAGGGGSALVDTFVTDPVESPLDQILDGGLTKDTEDLAKWFWKGAEPNDKNDIEHAFAAAYEHQSTGDLIIYFGLDRMDNSGDAAAGFWFLKKPVEQKTLDSDGDGDTENVLVFEGTNTLATHSVGDTLVQTDFTKGGSVERIEAYQWGVATGTQVQPGSPLRQIATGADCDSAPAGDKLCGQVNRNPETVPANWPQLTAGGTTAPYFFKGSGGVAPSSTFPTATFFEGGINATDLLGADFCAAQLLAETRQSQSETSTLEDKAEAGFKLCDIDVEKTGPEKSKVGDDATYTFKITNSGAVTLFKQEIDDSVLGDLTGNAGCGASLAPGASCTITADYTVQPGDPDPLINTVTVIYNRKNTLTGDQVTASDSHSVNLFQPGVKVTKGGDTLSKVGDQVTYTFEVENTGSSDSPNLILDTISDSVLGDLADEAPAACDSLAPGAKCNFNVNYTIQGGDPDPLNNTVTVHYHPDGFPNDITANDNHSTNLFQPSIELTKTGDTLSKKGDKVDYVITLKNTSSSDSPSLECTISDPTVGVNKQTTLVSGASEVVNVNDFTIPNDGADPFPNKATATCSPTGFPNVLTAEATHSVNLFQPNVDVEKDCDDYTKAGDTLACTITLKNTSSDDTPDLIMGEVKGKLVKTSNGDTVVDLGDLLDPANTYVTNSNCTATLIDDSSCSIDVKVTVPELSPTPDLTNKVSVLYHPDGFPNDIADNDSVDIDTLHPSFTVTKVCTTDPVDQGGTASFKITYNNTGDANLVFTPNEVDEGGTVAVVAGQSESVTVTRSVPDGATSVSNTVTGKVTLAATYGLSNEYTYSESDTCSVRGRAKVVKTVSGQPPAADQTFTFELRQGASALAEGTVLETKTTDASGNISFTTQLNPGETYQLCEWVFPGWNTNLAGEGPLFVPASILPPSLPNPNVNNLTVCVNVTVTSGQTRTFTVDNTPPPGGRALTIGFWKNWASCSNSKGKGQDAMLDLALAYATQNTTNPPGGLVVSAQTAGSGWPNYGPAWYLALKGDGTSTEDNIKPAPGCVKAVRLLNKSTIDTNKKKASDPLWNMTAQLVAAQLNRFMGAGISGVTITNIDKAVLLNGKYLFDGKTHTAMTAAHISKANCLAKQLDNYNNNLPVSNCP